MANSIYVTSTHRGSGKTSISLGLVGLLERTLGRVAFFKPVTQPVAHGVPSDARTIKEALGLPFDVEEMEAVSSVEVSRALANGTYDEILDRILEAYERIAAKADFVVIEGTDYEGAMATFEFNINADISKNLGAPALLVADAENAFETTRSGKVRDPRAFETMLKNIRMIKENLDEKNCEYLGLVMNRANPAAAADIRAIATEPLAELGIRILGTLPRTDMLEKPTIQEIAAAVDAAIIAGNDRLDVVAQDILVAAMGLENVLQRLQRGTLVLVPGDRDDLLVGLAAAYESPSVPTPSGLVLTGGLEIHENVRRLFLDLTRRKMPVLAVASNTYETAVKVSAVRARLDASQRTRIEVVKGMIEEHIDIEPILTRIAAAPRKKGITPKQFMHRVVDIARRDRRRIVLPEGQEERILRAAEVVLARGIADLTLLGNEEEIQRRIGALGLKLDGADIVDPATSPWRDEFAKEYQKLRSKKNPTWEHACDVMSDPTYFGTMMVQIGRAHGLVSGSITTTAATLRPALEFVRTPPGVSIASSVFFMLLPDTVLVYGDCAVNPNPTAEQLADIALASAGTARAFDIEPRVAMLSYSTGESGTGSDVDKVRAATQLVRARAPELLVEGPIQYDAAIDPSVARTKLPGSRVAGVATVFIFPDLNAGNNTYKAVQRAAKAIAVGPVMQGLRKPVNDLSRGCTVVDIINTIAITAVQAQRS